MTEPFRLLEPVPIDDDLCTGLAMIEDVELGARFVLYSQQTSYEGNTTVCVVRRKIVLPLSALAPAVKMTLAYLAQRRGPGGRNMLTPVK